MTRATTALLLLTLAISTPAFGQHWDIPSGCSPTENPSGPWTYGTRPTIPGTALLVFPDHSFNNGLVVWNRAATTQLGAPSVACNTGTATVNGIAPGRTYYHPGSGSPPDAAVCIIRWTAPYAGTFGVTTLFTGRDQGTTDVAVVEKGEPIFSAQRSGVGGVNSDKLFSSLRTLEAGDALDFAVGNAGSFYYDTTGIDISIDRVPCNDADVAGLGGAPSPDGLLTSDDIIYFLQSFFSANAAVADIARLGGSPGADGQLTVDDVVYYLDRFFAICAP